MSRPGDTQRGCPDCSVPLRRMHWSGSATLSEPGAKPSWLTGMPRPAALVEPWLCPGCHRVFLYATYVSLLEPTEIASTGESLARGDEVAEIGDEIAEREDEA
jgi:hypothetical protein